MIQIDKKIRLSLLLIAVGALPVIAVAAGWSVQSIKVMQRNKAEITHPKQQMAEHTEDLRSLMLYLYTLHPTELAKSTQVSAREMTEWVFDGKANWKFDVIRNQQHQDALALFWDTTYQGDLVIPLVVGIETMLFSAYGANNEFNIPATFEPKQIEQTTCDILGFASQIQKVQAEGNDQRLVLFLEHADTVSAIQNTIKSITNRLKKVSDNKLDCH